MSLAIRRELVDTPEGALGVLRCGDAGAPLLLLQQSPLGALQYRDALPRLAGRGLRVAALDFMGYGGSDSRRRAWTIEDFAASARAVQLALGMEQAAVVAGHFGAQAAIELAVQWPGMVRALVLDGTPLYEPQVRERLRSAAPPPAPSDDGAHAAEIWRRMLAFLKPWGVTPASLSDAAAGESARALYANFLRTNYEFPVMPAIGAHETAARLAQLRQPLLALTADSDSLQGCHEQVLALVPQARGHRFAGRHPLHGLTGGDASAWVSVVAEFLGA